MASFSSLVTIRCLTLAISLTLLSLQLRASPAGDALLLGFEHPPADARPRVWWHWMNGNITKEGIRLDLEWMKRIGLGGFQTFDASLGTPQVVDQRLAFMTPGWKDAFAYATRLADQLGLEMAIAGSPGWSETGGPWVEPAHAMKKLVWSEMRVEGGRAFNGVLPKPPSISGPFQDKPRVDFLSLDAGQAKPPAEYYVDSTVIAYRIPANSMTFRELSPAVTASGGTPDLQLLTDGNVARSFSLPISAGHEPAWIQYDFLRPQTVFGVTLGMEPVGLPVFMGGAPTVAELQSSDDGIQFRTVCEVPTMQGGLAQDPGEHTVAVSPTAARFFRIVLRTLAPESGGLPAIDLSALGIPVPKPPTEYHITEFALRTTAVVNHFEEKAAFAIGADLYASATPAVPLAAAIPTSDVLDLTDRMSADGHLHWTPSPGRWTVLRFGYSLTGAKNSPASPEATGLEVDKLDRRSVRAYLDHYLDLYGTASDGLMGKRGVQFMVTDSWEAGAQNWTDDLLAEFKRRRGYDMHSWMPVLAGAVVQSADASDRFLWDFRATLGELLVENHYAQIADLLRQRSMGLYSESHESGRAFIGDGVSVKKGATVPMGAMWTQTPGVDKEQYGYNADIRESASVAHVYGQRFVAAESLTAGSGAWAWAPENLKPTVDTEMAMGLNRFVIHTSVHQPLVGRAPGLSLGPFGQWFTRNETWAELAGPWIEYLARSSYLLQQGRFVADVAYFYGEDTNVTALFAKKTPEVPRGYNFDFINADALINALSVDHGELVAPSGMRYRVLVVDPNAQHMSLPVLRKLTQLVSAGAAIVGLRPIDTPSLSDDPDEFHRLVRELWGATEGEHAYGKGRVYSGTTPAEVLRALNISPDFAGAQPESDQHLLFVHRQLTDADLYFVDNRSDRKEDVDVSFRTTGKVPELWHADTGKHEPVSYRILNGRTSIPLSLHPYETVFVVFRQPARAAALNLRRPVETLLAKIDRPWEVGFPVGRGAPAQIEFPTLGSWSDSLDEGIRYFSGTATYATTVHASAAWLKSGARLCLDLGSVKNLAEVVLNDRNLGVLWKAPFRIDVTNVLKPGANRLRIRVTNLWVNRLIGDQQPNVQRKYTFTTMPFYKADSPLLQSGLLGPVQLLEIKD